MQRERSETITFTRDDLERIIRHMAQLQISSSLFIGKFGEQAVAWMPDGGIEVTTKYQQGGYEDLPAPSEQPALPKRKKSR